MAVDPFNELIHKLRGELLSEMPAAEVVVSAGCAGSWYFQWFDEKYPHRIGRHIGFDLEAPPDILPPKIEWHQRSFSDMSALPDNSVDLVYAGQAIEHISVAECLSFLNHAHRLLKDEGWLVMDSPNFSITGPSLYLHPEHVVEYTPGQMEAILEAAGFRILNRKGILLCRENGKLLDDPYNYERITDRRIKAAKERPEDSFIWWIEAVRSRSFNAKRLARLLTRIDRAYPRERARFGKREERAKRERTAGTQASSYRFRQALRRLIPRRLRWLARAAFKRITGLYYRDFTVRLDAIQHQVAVALPERLDAIQHQVAVALPALFEAQGEVMDLLLRRLRLSEEEVAAHLGAVENQVATLEERVAAVSGTVGLVQNQVGLLRTHLSASGILGPMNLKARTLQRLFEEANANTPREGAVVEIGCIRYPFESPTEGASTLYFARWCEKANRNFISIDAEREHLENARRLLDAEGLAADLVHADGREAISKLPLPIALLFLDGSNDPRETLEQFKAAEDKLMAGAIVAIDDVQQFDSSRAGKGEMTIPHTKERGWEVELIKTEPGYMMAALRRAAKEGDDSGR